MTPRDLKTSTLVRLIGDDDNASRFLKEQSVLEPVPSRICDEWWAVLHRNTERIQAFRDECADELDRRLPVANPSPPPTAPAPSEQQ